MFTVIGERINMSRKKVKREVEKRNAEFIAQEARKQDEAGATHIDINAGGRPGTEVEDMQWLTGVVSEATELPLVFDSANPEAIEAGLKLCNRENTIINSVTGEKERFEHIIPLVKKYNTSVVALTMDDEGMPEDYDRRMKITVDMAEKFKAEKLPLDRVYFDHLVRPASTNPGQAEFLLRAVSSVRKDMPDAHNAVGLSNISFGMPERNNLNRAFLAMLIWAGCDGFIIDPCEPGMMNALFSSRAVLGIDAYGMEYIKAYRGSKL